jgi:hypothetical protein
MNRIGTFVAIVVALAGGFLLGRFVNIQPVKAAGAYYVLRLNSTGNTVRVPPTFGSPVSLSCSGDNCYVLVTQP